MERVLDLKEQRKALKASLIILQRTELAFGTFYSSLRSSLEAVEIELDKKDPCNYGHTEVFV